MQAPPVDTSAERPKRIGIIVVALTFGVFGLWSLVAPLQSAALAPGTVSVKGSRKNIEHLEGGIVAEIAVQDGDEVAEGDLLLRLDDTQARALLEISMGQYYAVKAREARLLAERDSAEQVAYPELILASEDPRARESMASQNQVFHAARNARLGEIKVLEQRVAQLEQQIKGIGALRRGKEALVASYAEEIQDFSELLEEGFADKQRLRELQRQRTRFAGEASEHMAGSARLEIQIGETRLQILQLQKNFHTHVVDELDTAQTEARDLKERIRAAADRAERTALRAPVAGVVMGKSVNTIGEVVNPGESLLYIVPQIEDFIIEAQVNPADIDRVRNGQTADVRFSAFKSSTTPIAGGVVVNVSADAHLHEALGTSFYLARVELTPGGLAVLGDLQLVPGMPAEVLINTGNRTLFQYLTQPVRNAFARSLIED